MLARSGYIMEKFIAPPALKESYYSFKKELKLWDTVTTLEKGKRAPAVIMGLKDKAKKVALEIPIGELITVTEVDGQDVGGLNRLIQELDKTFLKDAEEEAYLAYDDFRKFKRPLKMPIVDYTLEFDRKVNRMKEHGMDLPDCVLGYEILNSASLSDPHMELARATVTKLGYKEMSLSVV